MRSIQRDAVHEKCIRLKDAPSYIHFCDTAMLNKDEFVVATTSTTEYKGVLKYNIHQNKWIEVMQYPAEFNISCIFMAFNEEKQKIFINSRSSTMITVDLNTYKCESFGCGSFDVANAACLVEVKGQIHVFDRGIDPKHWIWNGNCNTMQQIHDFPDHCNLYVNSAVYVKSKDIIILFCSSRAFQPAITSIWTYSYAARKFEEIDSVQCKDMGCCGIRLTVDDKYIIISCGSRGNAFDDDSDAIYVLDITTDVFVLKKSKIPAPMTGSCHVAMTGSGVMDTMLVNGYINTLYKCEEFYNITMIPSEIALLIASWYSSEMFHFIEFSTENRPKAHYAISVSDILSCLD